MPKAMAPSAPWVEVWLSEQRDVANAAVGELEKNQGELKEQKQESDIQAQNAKAAAAQFRNTLDVLISLLAQATPDSKLGTEVKVSDFLDTFAQQLETEPLADPKVEIEVRTTLANSFKSFSEDDKAAAQMATVEKLGRNAYAGDNEQLARFLFETARTGTNNQDDLLKEALELLDATDDQTLLRVQIWTQLGWLVTLDPELAEQRFRKAIELAETLDDAQRALLEYLPEQGLAEILNDQDLIDEARIQAKIAVGSPEIEVATFGRTVEQID